MATAVTADSLNLTISLSVDGSVLRLEPSGGVVGPSWTVLDSTRTELVTVDMGSAGELEETGLGFTGDWSESFEGLVCSW